MNDTPDQQLLSDYAAHRVDTVFAELVRRHINLVHSVAFRLTGEAHSAQDVTQAVFLALANNAAQLARHPVLPGWLHTTTRHLAAKTIRAAVRRQTREQEAAAMHELLSDETSVPWDDIAPHLDAALGELSEPDRDAILLRYFEKKSAPEIAATLGIGADAAQKRVHRALDRLRAHFTKRRIPLGAAGLSTLLSTQAVQAAPAGLAATLSTSALVSVGTGAGVGLVAAAKTIAMTTLQKSLVATTLALSLGFGVYEVRQTARLQDRLATIEQSAAQTRLSHERRLADLNAENARLRAEADRLRAEALDSAQVQAADTEAAQDPEIRAMADWLERVHTLRAGFKNHPEAATPEMQWLDDEDWLAAAKDNPLADHDDFRLTAATLRGAGDDRFAQKIFPALRSYLDANRDVFPASLDQLQPFLHPPIDPVIFERWAIKRAEDVRGFRVPGDWAITQKQAVDEEADQTNAISEHGPGSVRRNFDPAAKKLEVMAAAFVAANHGRSHQNPSDLLPYATTPAQKAVLEKAIAAQKPGARGVNE